MLEKRPPHGSFIRVYDRINDITFDLNYLASEETWESYKRNPKNPHPFWTLLSPSLHYGKIENPYNEEFFKEKLAEMKERRYY